MKLSTGGEDRLMLFNHNQEVTKAVQVSISATFLVAAFGHVISPIGDN
jgi:hypothetical protein